MPVFKTVGDMDTRDPLLRKQKEDVARMRTSLLLCSSDDLTSAASAISNITVLRIYHQISRIIRYLELMDKIEEKMYMSMEAAVDNVIDGDSSAWIVLMKMQERLQKNMIESHKLLEPYINISEAVKTVSVQAEVIPESTVDILDSGDRDRLRIAAQTILSEIESGKIG